MLNRVWVKKNDTYTYKRKVQEYVYRDRVTEEECFAYSYVDGFGRPHNLKDFAEAQQVIKQFKMEDVTEEMVAAGWISKAQYEAFKKKNAFAK
jgi:hypothetical protein